MSLEDRQFDRALGRVPGWFETQDVTLFRWFLEQQVAAQETGDLVELGAFLGKSAALIGTLQQHGEVFTVVDLFEEPAGDADEHAANQTTYRTLTQQAFERNYLSINPSLPKVVRGYSQDILSHARAGTHRFVHVDASHVYEHVRADAANAQALLQENGVVVFDDFRSPHTPGVAAAVWESVLRDGLRVLVIGDSKLYGTWSAPELWRGRLRRWLPTSGLTYEEHAIAGDHVLRVGLKPGRSWGTPGVAPSLSRRMARAVTPPVAVSSARWLVSRLPQR